MFTIVGNCPKCGAPIYSPSVWQAITPPPITYSCSCVATTKTVYATTCVPDNQEAPLDNSKTKLKTLEEHEKERSDIYKSPSDIGAPSGIACPACGKEMYDVTNVILPGWPPRKKVSCKSCGHVAETWC